MSNTEQASADKVATLSRREAQVCEAVWSDVPMKTIGAALGISTGTTRSYLDRVRLKLGVVTLVAIALKWERHLAILRTSKRGHKTTDMRRKRRGSRLSPNATLG